MLTIGGVDFTPWLERQTLNHLNVQNSTPDTLDFGLVPYNASGEACPVPQIGAEVAYYLPDDTRLFGGTLTGLPDANAGFGYASGLVIKCRCLCSDWRIRADAKILNDRFLSQTPGAIIVALFAKYAPEFGTSQVDTSGQEIGSIRFKRDVHLSQALDKLASLTGWVWDITPDKEVIWQPPGALTAPIALTDDSRNFSGLTVQASMDELKNRVIVRGGLFADTNNPITDRFTGDGLTTTWRLSDLPFGTDKYVEFEDDFGSLDASKWVQTDVTNPSPPAGHVSADGYLFTTTQQGAVLTESGWLQVVGGNSTWGNVRLMSYQTFARAEGRRFEQDVYATNATGQGRCGLWDPNNQTALAGEAYGFFFDAGTIKSSVGGVAQTALATVTYTAGKTVRLRIVLKAAGGATLWVNTDDSGDTGLPADQRVAWRPSLWTKLYDTATGTQANLTFAPIFNYNFQGRVDRARVFNRLNGIVLTVGGVEKVVGVRGADEGSGVDALVGTQSGVPVLAFFGDTKPASSAAVVITYYRGVRVFTADQDDASIAALKAIENPTDDPNGSDGIRVGYIEDESLNTVALAQSRISQELEQYGNPLVTLSFTTREGGLRAGQVLPVTLTAARSGRDLSDQFLIQQVQAVSLGSGNHEFTVTAGSRLKGLQDYLFDLLRAGKASDDPDDENEVIDELVTSRDTLRFTSTGTVKANDFGESDTLRFTDEGDATAGPDPTQPYVYGTARYGQALFA